MEEVHKGLRNLTHNLTDSKETLLPPPPVADAGTAHLNSSCVEASTAALGEQGKPEKLAVKNQWEESVWV